jgi:hypothetical protein
MRHGKPRPVGGSSTSMQTERFGRGSGMRTPFGVEGPGEPNGRAGARFPTADMSGAGGVRPLPRRPPGGSGPEKSLSFDVARDRRYSPDVPMTAATSYGVGRTLLLGTILDRSPATTKPPRAKCLRGLHLFMVDEGLPIQSS